MPARDPKQVFNEAKTIAREYGMFIAEQKTPIGTNYLLYRSGYPRNVFLGKRASVTGLRSLVVKCSGLHA